MTPLPHDLQTRLQYSVDSGRVYLFDDVEERTGEAIPMEARYNEKAREWSISTRRPRLTLEQTQEAIRTLFDNIRRTLTLDVAEGIVRDIVSEADLTDDEATELREWYRTTIREGAGE